MLTRREALSWLTTKEPWELHCKNVAMLSEMIAKYIKGLDSDYAYIYGLVHDIGRITEEGKRNPKSHPIEGWKFMNEKGYPKEAMSCITHSFPCLNDITLVPGMCHPEWKPNVDVKTLKFDSIDSFIIEKLKNYKTTIYDKIVLLSDLMSGGSKTITIEERLDKVYSKLGDKPNKEFVYQAIYERKREIEILTGKRIEEIVKNS